jgi:hypothetical protein
MLPLVVALIVVILTMMALMAALGAAVFLGLASADYWVPMIPTKATFTG